MTARTPDAVAALHEAAAMLEDVDPGWSRSTRLAIHQAAGKVRALADAHDPLAEAREALREAQAQPSDVPLEFGDRRPTVRVLMTADGYRALCRALGMKVADE